MQLRKQLLYWVATCLLLYAVPTFPQTVCGGLAGDCDQDGAVTIDELVTAVNILLGNADVASCEAADSGADGRVSVNELIRALIAALEGCDCPMVCDDGDPCTRDVCHDDRLDDRCAYGPIVCPDDGNECTAESCEIATGCISREVDDGVSCNGGVGECQSGACVALP